MSLDRRIKDEIRMKKRAEKKARSIHSKGSVVEPKEIGKTYTSHGAFCSCMMCGNPRKYFNEKTIAEKREDERSQIEE